MARGPLVFLDVVELAGTNFEIITVLSHQRWCTSFLIREPKTQIRGVLFLKAYVSHAHARSRPCQKQFPGPSIRFKPLYFRGTHLS